MLLERLKNLREDNDLLQKHVAKALKIPERTYGNYELGDRSIPLEILIELARFYNTSTDYILGLTDETHPYPPSKIYK
ncbi:MAG: helix-turn-helix domain-containing protein [Clostridia bacterium]|nr:helix-turn-helix domain-containing protein [Clostridia bacterium]